MIIPFRQPRSFAWVPGPEEIRRVLTSYFKVTNDQFFVVRSRTIGEVVARAAGIKWSPPVSRAARAVLVSMGVTPISFEHLNLYKGIMPANLTEDEAYELSAGLRKIKKRRQIA